MKYVFVLGAGASVPFQYPDGRTLLRKIVDNIRAVGGWGVDAVLLKDFQHALHYSGANSVDVFLERNAKYRQIGAMAIANLLIREEHAARLWLDVSGREKTPVDNWYKYLFNRLVDGVPFEQVQEIGRA